jgi:hypothetical protein
MMVGTMYFQRSINGMIRIPRIREKISVDVGAACQESSALLISSVHTRFRWMYVCSFCDIDFGFVLLLLQALVQMEDLA